MKSQARLSRNLLQTLSQQVAETLGLEFPEGRWHHLERAVEHIAQERGFESPEACAQWLLSPPLSGRKLDLLAAQLTVGETYFFRGPKTFELIRRQLIPEWLQRPSRRLRIWSAGCCTGEEPYSVAILLRQTLPNLRAWNLKIVGTDVNPQFLERARRGIYTRWSFRKTPQEIQERYFRKLPTGEFELRDEIRQMVRFAYLNLVGSNYPSPETHTHGLDLILCRNVLMYLTPEHVQQVLERFYEALVDGGYLIISPSEAVRMEDGPFTPIPSAPGMLYRKQSQIAAPIISGPAEHPPRQVRLPLADLSREGRVHQGSSFFHEGKETHPNPSLRRELPAVQRSQERERFSSPEAAPDIYLQAQRLYDRGEYGAASELLEAHLAQVDAQERADWVELLIQAYANQGKHDLAQQRCERELNRDQLNPHLRYLYATVLQEQGLSAEAVKALNQAVYLDPDFVMPHLALGNLAQQEGDPEESARHFSNALHILRKLPPDEIVPHSEGLSVRQLTEIVSAMNAQGTDDAD